MTKLDDIEKALMNEKAFNLFADCQWLCAKLRECEDFLEHNAECPGSGYWHDDREELLKSIREE